jgi:hypothetical protein
MAESSSLCTDARKLLKIGDTALGKCGKNDRSALKEGHRSVNNGVSSNIVIRERERPGYGDIFFG